jgi:hypothetical protein
VAIPDNRVCNPPPLILHKQNKDRQYCQSEGSGKRPRSFSFANNTERLYNHGFVTSTVRGLDISADCLQKTIEASGDLVVQRFCGLHHTEHVDRSTISYPARTRERESNEVTGVGIATDALFCFRGKRHCLDTVPPSFLGAESNTLRENSNDGPTQQDSPLNYSTIWAGREKDLVWSGTDVGCTVASSPLQWPSHLQLSSFEGTLPTHPSS